MRRTVRTVLRFIFEGVYGEKFHRFGIPLAIIRKNWYYRLNRYMYSREWIFSRNEVYLCI